MGYALSDVVNELMIEQGMTQSNQFARYYQLGVAGYRKFNMNTSGVPKVIELDLNSDDTVTLPTNYLQYTRVGLCINGEIVCLGRNDKLCLNTITDNCGNPIKHQTYKYDGYQGYLDNNQNVRNGEFVGGLFGIGADNNCLGYYRIDRDNNRIVLSQLTCFTDSIILEYIADIQSVDEDFDIHPFCVEPLKDWIFWKLKQRSSKPLGEQQLAKEDYHISSRLMRMQFGSSTKEEWLAAFRSGVKGTPKL